MDTFIVVSNNDMSGTYHIECRCVIYRAKYGKHPDWAKPEGDKDMGFNTKYFLLIEDNIQSESEAKKKAQYYEDKYADMIRKCEDTGNWDVFPFKNNEIVYYK